LPGLHGLAWPGLTGQPAAKMSEQATSAPPEVGDLARLTASI